MGSAFSHFATRVSAACGSPWAFVASLTVIVLWAAAGPVFGFSDTWQLVANTGTTIVTFWLVFVIQHTQNRDAAALQLKLDEVLRALATARNELIAVDREDDADLDSLRDELQKHREDHEREP
jgi:low affinity Fe/Cu permease